MPPSCTKLQALKNDQIDLWSIDPTLLSEQTIITLSSILSVEESDNLLKYKNKVAQHTALVTRSICRLVLAQYTKTSPTALQFIRNKHGKPELVDRIDNGGNQDKIRFNLSHNNHLIIIAVCVNDDIGCDIENPQRKVSIEPITRRFFAQQEHTVLNDLQGIEQQQRFFECWTLKEAFVKATGVGISLGLDTFYFDFNKRSKNHTININFNEHYPLDKNATWQFYQAPLKQQILSICRASHSHQSINYFDARLLLKE
tara:strand:- start:1069 stop:1839 length:771 start_codon:yes stop_codon:yes gene_type:complete